MLASHLHLPLQETKAKTTASEYATWMVYLNMEPSFFHREDYYLAMIAAEIRRTIAKEPKKVDIADFILNFKADDKKEKKKLDQEDIDRIAKRTVKSKAFWLGSLGIKGKV